MQLSRNYFAMWLIPFGSWQIFTASRPLKLNGKFVILILELWVVSIGFLC